jgi:hypothetical protein
VNVRDVDERHVSERPEIEKVGLDQPLLGESACPVSEWYCRGGGRGNLQEFASARHGTPSVKPEKPAIQGQEASPWRTVNHADDRRRDRTVEAIRT